MRTTFDAAVLVVEDDEFVRESVADGLEGEGYTVAAVGDGQKALDYLGAAIIQPRLILLDLMMPIMDGVEFRKRQLGTPEFAEIPVALFTADANGQQKAASLGVKGFLRKPVRLAALLDLVARLCGPADTSEPPRPHLR